MRESRCLGWILGQTIACLALAGVSPPLSALANDAASAKFGLDLDAFDKDGSAQRLHRFENMRNY